MFGNTPGAAQGRPSPSAQRGGRAQAIQANVRTFPAGSTSRTELLAFLQSREVPEHIKQLIAQGGARVTEAEYFVIKKMEANTKFILAEDTKQVGLKSFNGNAFPKNNAMLVSQIGLKVAKFTTAPTTTEIKQASFVPIINEVTNAVIPGFSTGLLKIDLNNKPFIRDLATIAFATKTTENNQSGYLKLHNPRFIPDETAIVAEIDFDSVPASEQHTHIMLLLKGTQIIPA
jgi:hypothetical protein